jgi:ribonucleoside-diphosphate reductase alpha chain
VRPQRNATVTTIAPTGTISIIAGASGGIEPLFSLAFMRQIMDRDRLLEVNELFEQVAKAEGFYSPALMEEIAAAGTLQEIPGIPDWVRRVFVTARDITPEWHTRMQAAFQRYTDNAVSKTVNFHEDATVDEVREVYWLAYRLGCKGATIYRDNSRSFQPMATIEKKPASAGALSHTDAPLVPLAAASANGTNGTGYPAAVGQSGRPPVAPTVGPTDEIAATVQEADSQPPVSAATFEEVLPQSLPEGDLDGWLGRIATPQGTVRLWVTEVAGRPVEVYVVLGKAGSDLTALAEGIGRMVSVALRAGIPVEIVIDQLKGIGGSRAVGLGPNRVTSLPDGIAKILQRHYFADPSSAGALSHNVSSAGALSHSPSSAGALSHSTPAPLVAAPRPAVARHMDKPQGDICPECGNATLMHVEGCKKCVCGYSEC